MVIVSDGSVFVFVSTSLSISLSVLTSISLSDSITYYPLFYFGFWQTLLATSSPLHLDRCHYSRILCGSSIVDANTIIMPLHQDIYCPAHPPRHSWQRESEHNTGFGIILVALLLLLLLFWVKGKAVVRCYWWWWWWRSWVIFTVIVVLYYLRSFITSSWAFVGKRDSTILVRCWWWRWQW